MTSLPRYRAIPATDLIVRPLADITLVYHRPSGQTHMVASPVPEILAALESLREHPIPFSRESGNPVSPSTDGPAPSPGLLLSQEKSIEAILGHLATHYDLGDPADARAAIETHLAEMAALGLVRRA